MKIATTIIAAIIIGMAVYYLAMEDRFSKFVSKAGEKEYVKPPDLKLNMGKFGLKDSGEREAPAAPDPDAAGDGE